MGVGAVGGAIGGAIGGAGAISAPSIGFSAVGGAGAAGAAGGALSIGANGLHPAFSAATATQLQNLSQLLKDFSSADILLFLMLMRGLDPQHKVHGGGGGTGGALLDLLAGLALARQVNQLTSDLTS
ncbi:MAG TPA: hypothetical protein VGM05_10810, partial [Planctomycetaceae bacterium]